MSLVMKVVAILAIVLAVQLSESEARKHITSKASHYVYGGGSAVVMPRKHNFHGESEENGHDTVIVGRILCEGEGKEGVRPLLESPEYPGAVINIVATNRDGWYRLTTSAHYTFHTHIYLTVRHQCEVEGLAPQERCAVPYYTTRIQLDVNNTTYIEKKIELSKEKEHSSADCLY